MISRGDLAARIAQRERRQPVMHAVRDRAATMSAMVSPADPHRERVGVEPGAAAGGTGFGELILPEEHPDVLLVALLLEVLEEGKDPDVPPFAPWSSSRR